MISDITVTENDEKADEKAVRIRLSESLFANPVSILVGSLVGIVGASFVAWETRNPWLIAMAALLVVASIWRTLVLFAYHRDPNRIERIHTWEIHFATAVLLFSALLGAASFTSLVVSDDVVMHMFLLTTLAGFVCTIAARNAANPWVGGPQVVVMLGPVTVGLLMSDHPIYWALAAICIFQVVSLIGLAKSIRTRFVEAFRGTEASKRLANSLQERSDLFNTALTNMNRGFGITRRDGTFYEANSRLFDMLGVSRSDFESTFNVVDLARASRRKGAIGDAAMIEMIEMIDGLGDDQGHALIHTNAGAALDLRRERTAEDQQVMTVTDVTTEWNDKQKIKTQATTDTLTGLWNRGHVIDLLREATQAPGAMMFLDLDGFKTVNDLHGHTVGDALLCQVSQVLKDSLRSDRDILGRIGGDEFVFFLPDVTTQDDATDIGRRVIEALSREQHVSGRGVAIGATIGVAFSGQEEGDLEELISNANLALHEAKNDKTTRRRGTVTFYTPTMKSNAAMRVALEKGLRETLARGGDELSVVYQPLFDTKTRRHVGCEALLRWKHPVLKDTTPDRFIPVAEESYLILALGEWVLRTACREATGWAGDWRVAVNLSPIQFLAGDIVATVSNVLTETGLSPNRLELEFTESILVDDHEKIVSIVQRLKDLGVRIALDDFGTGYSSLAYIHRLSFDKIKIDRAFVKDLADGDDSQTEMAEAIVASVVAIAGTKKLKVVAEGVETEGQLEALRRLGVGEGQGYLFSRPLPSDEFRQRFASAAAQARQSAPLRLVAPSLVPAE